MTNQSLKLAEIYINLDKISDEILNKILPLATYLQLNERTEDTELWTLLDSVYYKIEEWKGKTQLQIK